MTDLITATMGRGAKKRPIQIVGDVAYVFLTRGFVAIIDAEDATLVSGHNWSVKPSQRTFYARTSQYNPATKKQKCVHLHSIIVQPAVGCVVDHIDGDGLNNRRANLRVVFHGENMKNSRLRINNSSGVKGVRLDPTGKWRAEIRNDGKRHYLGLFQTKESAAEAYANASTNLHGAFGRLE